MANSPCRLNFGPPRCREVLVVVSARPHRLGQNPCAPLPSALLALMTSVVASQAIGSVRIILEKLDYVRRQPLRKPTSFLFIFGTAVGGAYMERAQRGALIDARDSTIVVDHFAVANDRRYASRLGAHDNRVQVR